MSNNHLCLKWNNHSLAFLNSISKIQTEERFHDATIACQGKYFPVHRIVLSTCSEYFYEIFERMQCQHPYIVFKDIEHEEMKLLLNYMYQGEVNVLQECLPAFIKAAEALKIKGLAVSDDLPLNTNSANKKIHTNDDSDPIRDSLPAHFDNENNKTEDYPDDTNKRQSFQKQQKKDEAIKEEPSELCNNRVHFEEGNTFVSFMTTDASSNNIETATTIFPSSANSFESQVVKEEPLELHDSQLNFKESNQFDSFMTTDGSSNTSETAVTVSSNSAHFFESQSSLWNGFRSENLMQSLPSAANEQSNVTSMKQKSNESAAYLGHESVPTHSAERNQVRIKSRTTRTHEGFHKCSYCDYKSYYSTNVKKHIMCKHTGELPFQCTFCSRRLRTKERLQHHTRSHTGEKPFQCHICLKRFGHKSTLKIHLQKKHANF